MGFNHPLQYDVPDPLDLTHEGTIHEILIGQEDEYRRLVQEKFQWSDDQMKLYSYYARLRRNAHNQMRVALMQREQERPEPTKEELHVGTYLDCLDPQVRQAVLIFRQKGYDTYASGFDGFGCDSIRVHETLPFEELGKTLPPLLQDDPVRVEVDPDQITLFPQSELSLPQLATLWNKIAAHLPDRGASVPPACTGYEEFITNGGRYIPP